MQLKVQATVSLTVEVEDGLTSEQIDEKVGDLSSELYYNFTSYTEGVEIVDHELREFELVTGKPSNPALDYWKWMGS